MEKTLYDLTSSQNSIWLMEEFISKTSMNIIGGYFLVDNSTINLSALNKAINLYRQKNDAVMLRFCSINGFPKQYLDEYSPKQYPIVELNSVDELNQHIKDFVRIPFKLTDSELFDTVLYTLPNGHGGFYAKFHHLISDAWSMSLFISEVAKHYSDIIHNRDIDSSLNPSYIDYINSEKQYFSSEKFIKDKNFWNSLFEEEPIVSHISTNSNVQPSTKGARIPFTLDSKLYNRINDFCKKFKCSINTFLMAVYSLYIAKINNNRSPIIGTPVLNRSGFKEKHTLGMFISTVPFKASFESDEKFFEYISKISKSQLSVFRHQKYPFDVLLKDIKKKYNLNENLYDLVVSYQNARDDKNESDIDYISTWEFTGHVSNTLEVHFYDMDNTGFLKVFYDYQISKLSKEEICALHSRILEMVNTVLDNPDICIKDISVITKSEQKNFIDNFNYTPFEYDKNISILTLFDEQVSKHKDDTAVIFEDEKLTYGELNNNANIIAKKLIDDKIGKNDVVGIMLNRSFDTLCSVWGVLKTGAAYLLIDPSLPEDRISYMLSNAKAKMLITTSHINISFENKLILDDVDFNVIAKDNISIKIDNDSLFCVIYTSGSTGLPKGVALKRKRNCKYVV